MVALGLLAAVIAPRIPTKVIAGHPTAAPVPGPPTVGACVTSLPPATIFSDAGSKYLVLPPMEYGSCTEHHYGEVTAVLQHLPLQRNPTPTDTRRSGEELWNTCPTADLEYVGLADPATGNAADPAAWGPALNARFVFAGPDARQKTAGQRWGACVLTASPTIYNQPVPYSGSVRGRANFGPLPAGFGSCAADFTVNAAAESCGDPHSFEILGSADLTTSGASSATRLADCSRVARRVTRMPDPTVGGRLLLQVRVDRYDSYGEPSRSSGPLRKLETQYGTCGIGTTGNARLHGSLLGLGTDPVPLT